MDTVEKGLAEWVAQNKKVDVKPAEVQLETKSEVTEVTEEPVKPEAVEAPKEQPEVKEETVEVKSKPWDADETEATKEVETPKFDFSNLGSALGLKDVKGQDEVVAEFSKIKTKLKELEDSPLSGVPEEFREVVEVAKRSGESWKDYLSESIIDYSKIDPQQLFEDDFYKRAINNPRFHTDGKFNEQLVQDALEAMPDSVRWYNGQQIQQALIHQQAARKQEIRARAEAKRENAEKSLSQATKSLQEILPVERYGIKFEPKHSSQIYEGISNSTLTKKHFGMSFDDLVRSGADMKAVTRTATLAEFGEKMLKFKSQASKVEAKKEILDKTQNAQIKTTGSIVTPQSSDDKKVVSVEEKMALAVKQHRSGGL
jgi:hypothetical protein